MKYSEMTRAIVVGASSGLGRAVAERLLKDGFHVGVVARREEKLEELRRQYPGKVEVRTIDVTDDDAGERLGELIGEMGGIDLYFHAAGIGKQVSDLDEQVEMATFRTNAMGFARMIGVAWRSMRQRGGGHIVAISSVAGTKGLGPAPSYSATKAMQNTYLEALAQLSNSRDLGIAVTDIRPGFVDTDLIRGSSYPMTMQVEPVANRIMKAIRRKEKVCTIDFRWRILVFFWRLVPHFVWRKVRL